jgi:hypothetical protein
LLEPTDDDAPRPASLALAQLKQRLAIAEANSWYSRFNRFWAASSRRYGVVMGMTAVLLIFAFSFPTVRVAASEFLSLFRVQNFTAVTISPEQISLLNKIAQEGLMPGVIEIIENPDQLTLVNSLDEAKNLTGIYQVRTIEQLGEPQLIHVSAPGSGRLTIDLAGSRAILEAVGVSPKLLSDDLDGAQVDVTVFAGVDQQWGEGLHLMQTESPLVEYPDGLNTTLLGQALLQLLGLSEAEAIRLSQNIDWTTTMLLPIARDVATYQEVTVDGVSGMAISSLDGRHTTIIWHNNGILYSLAGNQTAAELVELANTLK